MNFASVQVQQILTSIYGNFIFIFPSKIIESLRRRHSFLTGDSRSRATCVMHEVCWTTCSVFTQACLQEVSVWAEGRSQSITAAVFRSDKVANACYQPPPAKWISLQQRRCPSTVVSVVVCSFVFFSLLRSFHLLARALRGVFSQVPPRMRLTMLSKLQASHAEADGLRTLEIWTLNKQICLCFIKTRPFPAWGTTAECGRSPIAHYAYDAVINIAIFPTLFHVIFYYGMFPISLRRRALKCIWFRYNASPTWHNRELNVPSVT